ncbi:DUF3329 domain-containing protein [Pediococcus pentosaceus]|uniref:DUF3329 domain-containing protein n=1 Tax=Pediococcus pentosaceus TaxID=1255 RepID=UPI000D00B28C|nr:DUF6056 family protein [Pediococcus pentosaceus]AVL02704.1 hypothetical protein PP40703_07730 [Pediococcus pentosaceus]MBF7134724.1 MucBP domain-containing protein [Pediococcus pentosaceus]QPT36825.1 MucBP domain-containing protein [Pediococcus pentosaceus]
MVKKASKFIKYGALFVGSLAVMAVIFTYILNINKFAGLTGDDFLYHFVYEGEWPAKGGPQEYHNLYDWMRAIHTHMTQWNARFTSIVFEIAAMQFPKWIINIVNTVVYLVVGFEINILTSGKRAIFRPLRQLAIYLLMWFFLAGFGSTVLWVSGTSNYLWPAVLMLGFFMPYRFDYHVKKYHNIMAWFVLILGVLVGMSNEVGSSTSILVVGFFSFFNRSKKDFNDLWWKTVGTVANAVAFICMLKISSGSAETKNYGKGDGFIYHLTKIILDTVAYSGPLLLVTFMLGLYVVFSQRQLFRRIFAPQTLTSLEQATLSGMIFLVSGLAGVGAMIISPVLFPRLWFAVNVLLIISLFNFFEAWQIMRKYSAFTSVVLVVAVAGLTYLGIPSYQFHLANLKESYNVFYTHEQLAKEVRAKGKKIVHMPGIQITTDLYNPYDGTPYIMPGNKKLWANTWMAWYWKVDRIILDNSVPVRQTPQKDFPLITQVEKFYDKHIEPTKMLKNFKFPQITEKPKYVRSINNQVAPKSVNTKLDNSNLPANKPWLRNALIRYINVDTNRVVGTEQITSPYGQSYNISNASIVGYDTLKDNPKSYIFTKKYNQTINLKVKPHTKYVTLYFNQVDYDGKHKKSTLYATTYFLATTGQTATIQMPAGFIFKDGSTVRKLDIKENTGEVLYEVKKAPFKQQIKIYRGYYLLGIMMIVFVVLDVLLAWIGRVFEKRKQEE